LIALVAHLRYLYLLTLHIARIHYQILYLDLRVNETGQ